MSNKSSMSPEEIAGQPFMRPPSARRVLIDLAEGRGANLSTQDWKVAGELERNEIDGRGRADRVKPSRMASHAAPRTCSSERAREAGCTMNDREYRKWVKTIVVEPVLKNWRPVCGVLHRDMLHTMMMAQCMSVVMTWSISKGEDKRTIEAEEIQRLVHVVNDLMFEGKGGTDG